jgi:hypothetical protein
MSAYPFAVKAAGDDVDDAFQQAVQKTRDRDAEKFDPEDGTIVGKSDYVLAEDHADVPDGEPAAIYEALVEDDQLQEYPWSKKAGPAGAVRIPFLWQHDRESDRERWMFFGWSARRASNPRP